MNSQADSRQQSPSSFVTVLAWIFLVISGFTTLVSVLQNVMITFFFPVDALQANMHSVNGSEHVPAFFRFMFGHLQSLFAAFLLLSASLLASSVALLKRKNWARIAFIVFFALGIVWNIGGLFLQYAVFSSMPQMPSDAPSAFQAQFASMTTVMLIASSFVAIACSTLFGWLIKRLTSPAIRAEFQSRAV